MKKTVVLSFILSLGICGVFGEPIPQQEPSSADSPYYMDSQNILREKTTTESEKAGQGENSQSTGTDMPVIRGTESESGSGAGTAETGTTETESETQQPAIRNGEGKNEATENQTPSADDEIDEITGGDDNPINYDASEENIKDKNFKPVQKVEEEETQNIETAPAPVKKEKKKKTKKNKKTSETEEVTDNIENVDPLNSDNAENAENAESTEEQPAQPKTYSQDDFEQMYRDMPVPTFTFVHGVDPDQYYDMKDTAWSPYPLFRLNAPIYFKTITIPPGYYLLTPRKYKGDWYLLFKEAGVVKYTIPVIAKDYTSEFYYRDNLKELDMKKSQRWQIKFLNSWGKYIRKSKRKPAIQTNLELTDLDNNFLLIDLYYGSYKYTTIFRTERF
ncbi:MAG: hypothetical protein LUB59_07225 [Candidatus Gastranaerophilales bacterium]|nr:hypothetical protein [Candidatus Gastranaerophilales bacterium]